MLGKRSYNLNIRGSDSQPDTYGSINLTSYTTNDNTQIRDVEELIEQDSDDDDIIRRNLEPGCFFDDGIKKIDFVLVYQTRNKDSPNDQRTKNHIKYRQKFIAHLEKVGLLIEEDVRSTEDSQLHFVKLHAPWELLCVYAETLNIRVPLQVIQHKKAHTSEKILQYLHIPNIMQQKVPNQPRSYITCPFKISKLKKFLGSENRDTFFSSSQRSYITHQVLQEALYGKRRRGQLGITRLVEEGAFSAAFPLHDGTWETPPMGVQGSQYNTRQILYRFWARWGAWYKYQPVDHIRTYFGEKIAMYFAWLGFYTTWLLPAAIVGLLVFLYGAMTVNHDVPNNELCNSDKKYKMCPLCEQCKPWYLSEVCIYARIGYLFDHPGTVFFSIFVSFWAVTFLEYWKRKQASLSQDWECRDYEEVEEPPRPEFTARAPATRTNPVTGVEEPYFPNNRRKTRIVMGLAILLIMVSMVFIFIIAVIIYRIIISTWVFQLQSFRNYAQVIASSSGALINLFFILFLGRVYERLAFKLTEWEMHRTQSEFDNNLTMKVFLFQFTNFYSCIIYVAFFKGKMTGSPGHYNSLFGLRNEECHNGSCLVELAQQLAVIMIGNQIVNNVQELLIPRVITWWQKKASKKYMTREMGRMEADYNLVKDQELFQEYQEMVLQFGFITIFVAAFPLAPLFALLNNWIEIRLDAQKFVRETRRIVAQRIQNIGVWFTILHAIAHLAVLSNACLIAFTSDFLPRMLYQYEFDWELHGYIDYSLAKAPNNSTEYDCYYRSFVNDEGEYTMFYWKLMVVRLAFVIIFEHVVFFICRMIDIVVPDIPKSVLLKIKREKYLARQALQETGSVLLQGASDNEDEQKPSNVQVSSE